VRLGIEAPSEIPVHRQEVFEAIQREHGRNMTGREASAQASRANRAGK
jgi:carbon storage regulator